MSNIVTFSSETWFEIDPRPSVERTTFEADQCNLGNHKQMDFQVGKTISDWKGEGWFAAATSDMEGPLEDVLKTSNLLPVFSERLKSALEANSVPGMQYLPVQILDSSQRKLGSYFLVNVLNSVQALNERLSLVDRTRIKERDGAVKEWISYIRKTVFFRSALEGHDIIRLPGYFMTIYVSPRFKRIFEDQSFTGIGFLPIELSD